MVGSAGTRPTDLPSASYTVSVASDVLGRRQRRRPSGDGITLFRLRFLIWVPVQSSPWRPVEGSRYQMNGPDVVAVTDGGAGNVGTARGGGGVGMAGCPVPGREGQRAL